MKLIPKSLIASLCIIGCIYGKIIVPTHTWFHCLVTILKQDTKTNQLLLLYEVDFNNSGIYQIAKNISRMIPTQVADFTSIAKINNQRKLSLQKTTTILIISNRNANQNLSKIYNVMNSIFEISKPKTRPKVLIITKTVKRATYQQFFLYLWTKQFLDTTILEVKEIFPENSIREVVKLHHYNPFTKMSTKKKFSKNSILFPDKLRNLNGYQMKAGIFHYPPYVYVERNSTGHVVNIYGTDISLMKVMSKYLNFSLEMVISNTSNWDLINCDKAKNVGITNKTIHNEIQFIAIQGAIYETCLNNFVAISKGTKIFRFVFVAPILPSEVGIFTNELHLFNIMSVLSLFLIPVLLARYYNFDRQKWKMIYAIQMVLGFPIPKMPEKTMERIIFLSMLFFYFLQSSYIFTTLSEMQLQKKSFRKMETFKDLLDANLTLVISANLTEDGGLDDNDPYEKLMKNEIISNDTLEKWMEVLTDHKNISYMSREDLAQLNIKRRRNVDKVKVLKNIAGLWPSGIYLEEGSPYKYRFDSAMSVFTETGLSNKWDARYIPKSIVRHSFADIFQQEISLTSKATNLMIALLLFGYSCSFLVFAIEIVIDKYFKS